MTQAPDRFIRESQLSHTGQVGGLHELITWSLDPMV